MAQQSGNCETDAKRRYFDRQPPIGGPLRHASAWLMVCAVVLGLAAGAGASQAARPAAVGANASITMDCAPGCQFQPASLTVLAGTTVKWTGAGLSAHTTTSNTGIWDSGLVLSGQSFSRTFDTPGTFPYQCTVHSLVGMTGTINVVSVGNHIFMPFLAKESDTL